MKANMCRFFDCLFYIYIVIGDIIIREDGLKRRRVGIPLTGLTPPHFDACLNPGFPTLYVMLVFLFNCLR